MRCKHAAATTAVLALLVVGNVAVAADSNPFADNLTGDWGGARTKLHDKGVDLSLTYVGDFAHNFSGGDRRTSAYAAAFDFVGAFDFEKMFGWKGGSFHIELVNLNGTLLDTKANLGSLLDTQEIWAPGHVTYTTNFYLEQSLWSGKINLKYGRMDFPTNFYPFSCNFQNLGFCSTLPSWIDGALIGWPTSAIGGSVTIAPTDRFSVKLARFADQPNNFVPSQGIKPWNRGRRTGNVTVAELDFSTSITARSGPAGMAGTWAIGGWHNSEPQADLLLDVDHRPQVLTDAAPLMRGSASGFYVTGQQQVTQNAAGGGISLFANFVQADHNVVPTDQLISVGFSWAAPLPARAGDSLNFAIGRNHVSSRISDGERIMNDNGLGPVPVQGNEFVSEISYIAQLSRGISLMPNIQYIHHPGGTSANHDAAVLGCQVSVTF